MDSKINNIDSYNTKNLLLQAKEARDSAVNAKINGYNHDIVLGKVPQLSPDSIKVLKQLEIPLPPSLDNWQKKNDLNTRITNLEKAIGNEKDRLVGIVLTVLGLVIMAATIFLMVFFPSLSMIFAGSGVGMPIGAIMATLGPAHTITSLGQSVDKATEDLKTSLKNYIQSVDEGGELSKILQDNLDYFNEHGEEIIQKLQKSAYNPNPAEGEPREESIYIQEVRKVVNYYKKFAPSMDPPSYQETMSNVPPNYPGLGL